MARDRPTGEHRLGSIGYPGPTRLFSISVRLGLFLFIACSAAGELAGASPPARDIRLALDRKECRIRFSLPAVLHTVRGTFEVREGDLRLDVDSGKIAGRVVVDVTSGNTGEEERDRRMHQEVLESDKFPEAVFTPDRLAGQLALSGESHVSVHGVLRIHGQDHNVDLPVMVSLEGGRFTAASRLSIPYVRWGMKDPSTLILRVSKTVEVEISVTGTVRQE